MKSVEDTHDRIDTIMARQIRIDRRLDKIEESIAANTKLTEDIRDLFVTARTTTKIVKGIGAIAAGLTATGAAILWFKDYLK